MLHSQPSGKHRVSRDAGSTGRFTIAALRSPQFSAIALLVAAALGLVAANSPIGPSVSDVVGAHLDAGILDLSVRHWVTDGLIAVFFFTAALELKHELVAGELNSAAKAAVPAAAAIGGVLAPAAIYLLLVGEPDARLGWPIPTATDIAFALGVLALVGRSLPPRVRALLLALAVIDDLIAILIIAVFFTTDLRPFALLAAVPIVVGFALLSRVRGLWAGIGCLVLAVAAWLCVTISGIHPTVAGVALGLVFAQRSSERIRHAIEPWSNVVILPVFAFVATLVVVPDLAATPLGPVFWTILVALPVGKIIGITAGASLAGRFGTDRIPLVDVLVVAALGGIGFTVSLLMNELAFAESPEHATEGTLGVLAASVVAIIVGGSAAAARSRWYAARGPRPR